MPCESSLPPVYDLKYLRMVMLLNGWQATETNVSIEYKLDGAMIRYEKREWMRQTPQRNTCLIWTSHGSQMHERQTIREALRLVGLYDGL